MRMMMDGLGVLIPCKSFRQGKSRLSGLLSPESRQQLCRSFLLRTLELARAVVTPNQIGLISDDPDVLAVGDACGARTILDPGRDLNVAVSVGRRALLDTTPGISRLVIIPTDLPLSTTAALAEVMARDADVVVVPDDAGSGTNLLHIRAAALHRFPFCYGPGSLHAHTAAARDLGLSLYLAREPSLGFDIDEPQHYTAWMEGKGTRFHAA